MQPMQAESRYFGGISQYWLPSLDLSRVSIGLVKVWLHRGTISAAVMARRGESPHPTISSFLETILNWKAY